MLKLQDENNDSKPHMKSINLDALEGHPYEIKDSQILHNGKKWRQYIWRYEGWNKIFFKTWNLVYHFRVHTNVKPFYWGKWGKQFTQKSNMDRHMPTHSKDSAWKRKIYGCPKCSRKYTDKYNRNVSDISLN